MKWLIDIIRVTDFLIGFIGREKLYHFFKPWITEQIKKIDLPDDMLEEKTEEVLELIADIILRCILGLPLNKEL